MESAARYLHSICNSIRIADAIDILVVASFLYALGVWFKNARSRFVLVGFASLVGLYFLARVLQMYLTLMLFQAGVTVALVAIVVIFQEDLRRAFERIGSRGLLSRRRPVHRAHPVIDLVVESAAGLAKQRVGALLVLAGRDPLERHLTGGYPLDGEISPPLLYSIFDTSSAGHDGAVIIEHQRVRRFGVHLPLSTTAKDTPQMGTRHTAAMGLSERCDALVVVVSEERGVISLARNGVLTTVRSASELKAHLSEFMKEVEPVKRRPWRGSLMLNLGWKLAAMLLAMGAWILVVGLQHEEVARTFTVPIAYRDVPNGWIVEEPKPLEAKVTMSGSDRAFRTFDPAQLMISVDISGIRPGAQRLSITDADLDRPRDLTLHRIEPRFITLVAHETVTKDLPVRPQTVGKLPGSLHLVELSVEPEQVPVVIRKDDVGRVGQVKTEPIDLSVIEESTVLQRELIIPKDTRFAKNTARRVHVRIKVEPLRSGNL